MRLTQPDNRGEFKLAPVTLLGGVSQAVARIDVRNAASLTLRGVLDGPITGLVFKQTVLADEDMNDAVAVLSDTDFNTASEKIPMVIPEDPHLVEDQFLITFRPLGASELHVYATGDNVNITLSGRVGQ